MSISEKSIIQRIRSRVKKSPAIVAGIGDDCAVVRVPAGHELLVTTDFTLENVHFRRDWHRPDVVGRRCLTRGLSDIAAMGGVPLASFLSLALPRDVPVKWVDRFFAGMLKLATECNAPLGGGDTAESPRGIQADIMVLGSAPRGRAILRSGARKGDQIYVTGELGGSAAAIAGLQDGRTRGVEFNRHFHPAPRIKVGQWLGRHGVATAMIDISDGLSTDLEHICKESHVGAVLEVAPIPLASVGQGKTTVSLDQALHGGDDYELLFTSSQPIPSRIEDVRVTRIGEIVKGNRMMVVEESGRRRKLVPAGWQHFR